MPEKNACLRYFTGTGNSLRVLQICEELLMAQGYAVEMASITGADLVGADAEVFGFCFPVYALGLPRVAMKFLSDLPELTSPKRTFLFVTAGDKDDIGWALLEGRKILDAKGYRVTCSDLVRMPNNWVPILPVPSKAEAQVILAEGEWRAAEIMGKFIEGQEYHKPFNLNKLGPIASSALYNGFHKLGIRRLWRKFKVMTVCTSCGLCARICPMKSIRMEEGKPKWSKTCEQCMRCINFCPTKAIQQLELIGKGSRNNRYHEPHFHPAQHKSKTEDRL